MALDEAEKVKIRHHTGYLNVAEVSTFVLGAPAAVETQFIIEGAMNRVLESALPELRRHLAILEKIECEMVGGLENLAVTNIGTIQMNPAHQKELRKQYLFWRDSLCNIMGVYPNPFDKRFSNSGINVSVNH